MERCVVLKIFDVASYQLLYNKFCAKLLCVLLSMSVCLVLEIA